MKIKGVEIFSAGTWNGDTYTVDDLNEMVRAFTENMSGARPRLKLGHDAKQRVAHEMLKPADGKPAVGWIEKLYVKGEKLVADFSDIHEKVFSAIQKKAYRKVSSEIFHNMNIGGKVYKKMLAAVALLGEDTPGVLNLEDIMSSYTSYDAKYDKLAVSEFDFKAESENKPIKEGKKMKTENEIKLELELEQKEAKLAEFTAKADADKKAKADQDKEIADLKEFKAKAEKREQELLVEKEAARVASFTAQLVSDKLCTPAMKPLIESLLGETKKEYTVKIADKETKLSKEEVLKEALKLFKAASEVNFEESSSEGDDSKKKNKDDERDAKAREFMSKNKECTYGQALKAVIAQEKQQA